MNSVKSSSLNKLRMAANLFAAKSTIPYRKIFTTPPGIPYRPRSTCYDLDMGLISRYVFRPPVNLGICYASKKKAYVVERYGKDFTLRTLTPGFNLLIPFVDRIAFVHSLELEAIPIHTYCITKDSVSVLIHGVLSLKLVDPLAAYNGVDRPLVGVVAFAQSSMLGEIAKITLDSVCDHSEERDTINKKIMINFNNGLPKDWGFECLHHKITSISFYATDEETEAEPNERAQVLESEEYTGRKQTSLNIAEGKKKVVNLEAEEVQALFAKLEEIGTMTEAVLDMFNKVIDKESGVTKSSQSGSAKDNIRSDTSSAKFGEESCQAANQDNQRKEEAEGEVEALDAKFEKIRNAMTEAGKLLKNSTLLRVHNPKYQFRSPIKSDASSLKFQEESSETTAQDDLRKKDKKVITI